MAYIFNEATGTRYPIRYNGASGYSVPTFPKARGCRTDLDAFRTAKRIAKRAGNDVGGWRLITE